MRSLLLAPVRESRESIHRERIGELGIRIPDLGFVPLPGIVVNLLLELTVVHLLNLIRRVSEHVRVGQEAGAVHGLDGLHTLLHTHTHCLEVLLAWLARCRVRR